MSKSWITILCFLVLAILTKAQSKVGEGENLIDNPSFESHRECPHKIDALGTMTIVEGWFQPTAGSADYFNLCGTRDCSVPQNKLGIQEPRDGIAYCGIYCSKPEYREYLQTQLKQPLEAGKEYRLTFYVSLSEYSSGTIATIGGLLTKERLSDTTRNILMKKYIRHISPKITQTVATYYEPQVVNPYEAVITDTKNWTRISGVFTAEGGEEFLTIGNFCPTSKSNLTDIDSLSYILPGSYFYIDSVSLYRINYDTSTNTGEALTIFADTSAEIITSTPLEKGSTVILENIFFEFDKSTLLQQSYHELKKLTDILLQYPKMKIEIGGHTDSRGSTAYNQRLSESRARAVVEYLSSKGIDSRRLKFKGYGSSKPIDTNSTEEGRARNRRVEFTVLDM